MAERHPGPWKLVPGHGREYQGNNMGWIEDANGERICDFGDDTRYYPSEGHPPEGEAAALMLAAPEMAELLRHAITVCDDDDGRLPEIRPDRIRALLSRIDEASRK